ncbi:MAG: Clp protease N-terminal domain-containing protein, partial [Oscillospiraceae bacterium]
MNTSKLTQKSTEALQEAQNLAIEYQNSALEPEHLLFALMEQEGSLTAQLFKKLGVDCDSFVTMLRQKLSGLPKVSGTSRQANSIYISDAADKALTSAEKTAQKMGDEYISVEHLVLGIMDTASGNVKELFRVFNLDKNRFLSALQEVRGNTRVTSDNPEGTYDVLAKYGQDLVALARAQKLDPVIGRDSEIRNVI